MLGGVAPQARAASSPAQGDKKATKSPFVITAAGGIRIVPIRRVPPRYPAEAQDQGIQGCVDVEFYLDHKGRPTHLQAWASVPNGVFDQAAIQTVATWLFRVTDRQGQLTTAGAVPLFQPIIFSMYGTTTRAYSIINWICHQPPPRTLVVASGTASAGIRILKSKGDKWVDVVRMPDPHHTLLKNGWVDVGFCINAKGRVTDTSITSSSPHGLYDRAALAALKSWSFSGRKNSAWAVKTCGLRYHIPIIGAASLARGPAVINQRPTAIPTRDLSLPKGKIPPKGRVTLQFCIDKEGSVSDATTIKSQAASVFDQTAVQMLQIWKYWPKTVNDNPVRSCGIQETVVFKLGHSHLVWVYPAS